MIEKDVRHLNLSKYKLINIFQNLNNKFREAGLRNGGAERVNEFSNILFIKLHSEYKKNDDWNRLKNTSTDSILNIFKDLLKNIDNQYNSNIYIEPIIKEGSILKEIITQLDKLELSSIDTDIKGDAFEYFLKKTNSLTNELGEYFTPRHIIKAIVNLVNPKFKEKIYDAFCGTGGFLVESYNYIKKNTLLKNEEDFKILKQKMFYGGEITTNSRLAKMNMILHGDGHSGIKHINSLANPKTDEFDIVITNIPFSQKVDNSISSLYYNGIGRSNGDSVCVLHCFRAVKKGGKLALIVPEGFLMKGINTIKFLLKHAVLKSVIYLHKYVFVPYTKGVETYVLYFVDCHLNSTKENVYYYDVNNDGYSKNQIRDKIKENDLLNLFQFNFIDKEEDIKNIGFYKVNINKIKENNYNLINRLYKENINKNYTYKIKDILTRNKTPIIIQNNVEYTRITIKLKGQGAFIRDKVLGSKIGTKKQYTVKKGQFIISKIDARNGAFGFITEELDGAIITSSFWTFDVDTNKVNVSFLKNLFSSKTFMNFCQNKSQGTTNRQNLNESKFLDTQIPLPTLQEQNKYIKQLDYFNKNIINLKNQKNEIIEDIHNLWL